MTLADKILFLENSMMLNDREFSAKFKISKGLLKGIKHSKFVPNSNDLSQLCEILNVDVDDFINDSSTLDSTNVKPGEHICAIMHKKEKQGIIYEEFAREDNSRYEEKD